MIHWSGWNGWNGRNGENIVYVCMRGEDVWVLSRYGGG